MNYMTGWDESQIRRAMFRMALLVRRGLTAHLSEWWADRLTVRDKERDDRRICLECSSLQRDGKCFQVQQGVMRQISRHFQRLPALPAVGRPGERGVARAAFPQAA